MKVLDFPQGSPEWALARAAKVTGSRAADVIATIKSGEAAARRDYRTQLVIETLTGKPAEDGYVSRDMERGTELEPFARAAYEVKHGILVDEVGFVLHPENDRIGCSPDGLVGTDGMLQIKCPKSATHLQWLRAGVVPAEHKPQMLLEMACTGRAWSDFVSFDDRLPKPFDLFIVRYKLDPLMVLGIIAEAEKLLAEVDAIVAELKDRAA